MNRGTGELAQMIFEDIPKPVRQRSAIHEWDYGDSETLLQFLRRTHAVLFASPPKNSYGVYLGHYEGKYVVGIHDKGKPGEFLSCELFDTLIEMKDEWMVDEPDWESYGFYGGKYDD
jgi:hypothetical protein